MRAMGPPGVSRLGGAAAAGRQGSINNAQGAYLVCDGVGRDICRPFLSALLICVWYESSNFSLDKGGVGSHPTHSHQPVYATARANWRRIASC